MTAPEKPGIDFPSVLDSAYKDSTNATGKWAT